jgi:hypothetical protein
MAGRAALLPPQPRLPINGRCDHPFHKWQVQLSAGQLDQHAAVHINATLEHLRTQLRDERESESSGNRTQWALSPVGSELVGSELVGSELVGSEPAWDPS